MRWRNEPRHKLLPLTSVRGETGLDPEDVVRRPDTQRLVRIDQNGRREELVRIPVELLLSQPDAQEAPASIEGDGD